MIASVSVQEDGDPAGVLTTEKRRYVTSDQMMTEVGIRSTFFEDLYLILSAVDDPQAALAAESEGIDLQVLIKPLVGWIWFGTLMLVLGTVIALWPSADRRRGAASSAAGRGRAEPTPVGTSG
jgi:cytochrome c-type biogenesis protein CcmF